MRRIKPGYYILLAIALFFIYRYFFDDTKKLTRYTKEVNSILADIEHQDYFAMHNKLSQKLKQTVSIEDIKEYIDRVKLGNKYKFIFKDYENVDNRIKILGTVIVKAREIPLQIIAIEKNGRLEILEEKIGTHVIKGKKLPFSFFVARNITVSK